jgi:hypothetical protein
MNWLYVDEACLFNFLNQERKHLGLRVHGVDFAFRRHGLRHGKRKVSRACADVGYRISRSQA